MDGLFPAAMGNGQLVSIHSPVHCHVLALSLRLLNSVLEGIEIFEDSRNDSAYQTSKNTSSQIGRTQKTVRRSDPTIKTDHAAVQSIAAGIAEPHKDPCIESRTVN